MHRVGSTAGIRRRPRCNRCSVPWLAPNHVLTAPSTSSKGMQTNVAYRMLPSDTDLVSATRWCRMVEDAIGDDDDVVCAPVAVEGHVPSSGVGTDTSSSGRRSSLRDWVSVTDPWDPPCIDGWTYEQVLRLTVSGGRLMCPCRSVVCLKPFGRPSRPQRRTCGDRCWKRLQRRTVR